LQQALLAPHVDTRMLHLAANIWNMEAGNLAELFEARVAQELWDHGVSVRRRLADIVLDIAHEGLAVLSTRIRNANNLLYLCLNAAPISRQLLVKLARGLVSELVLENIQSADANAEAAEDPGQLEAVYRVAAGDHVGQTGHGSERVNRDHELLGARIKERIGLRVHPLEALGLVAPGREKLVDFGGPVEAAVVC